MRCLLTKSNTIRASREDGRVDQILRSSASLYRQTPIVCKIRRGGGRWKLTIKSIQRRTFYATLCIFVHLSLASFFLVLRTRSISRDGTYELGTFSNTFTLLALVFLLGNLGAMVSIGIRYALLLSRSLVEAFELSARIGLRYLALES